MSYQFLKYAFFLPLKGSIGTQRYIQNIHSDETDMWIQGNGHDDGDEILPLLDGALCDRFGRAHFDILRSLNILTWESWRSVSMDW